MRVDVRGAPFDPGVELDRFVRGLPGAGTGAVVTFSGLVRDDEGLAQIEIEHYPGMTERAVAGIADEATRRWSLTDILVIHRHGPMRPGETIMMVATAAPHRRAAFAAADFVMDYLKSRAPFWKKEVRVEDDRWVAAKAEDEASLARWKGA